jgi:hypothetical protein
VDFEQAGDFGGGLRPEATASTTRRMGLQREDFVLPIANHRYLATALSKAQALE